MPTSHEPSAPRRGPGRPREFDIDAALDGAIEVFRERGYHAASIGELGVAMQLSAGSLYKAFDDKRGIFLAAFARYTQGRSVQLQARLTEAASGREKVRAALHFYAESSCGVEGRRGCLVTGSAMALATFDEEVAGLVTAALQRLELQLRELLRLGLRDGSIAASVNVEPAALSLLCLVQGLRVVGKLGRTRAEMVSCVDQALRALA